jgi:hypothetical protein
MGLYATERETIYGKGYKVVKDENGNLVNRKDKMIIGGSFQAIVNTFKSVKSMKEDGFLEWWNKQPPLRRQNLMRTVIKGILFMAVFSLGRFLWKEEKVKWLYSELGLIFFLVDPIKNPVPALAYLNAFIDAILNPSDLDEFMKRRTPIQAFTQFDDYYESVWGALEGSDGLVRSN